MNDIVKFSLLKRRPDLSPQAYSRHWRETHADVLVRAGHAEYNASYVQNHFEPLDAASTQELLFDGAAQMRQKSESNVSAGFQEDPRYPQYVRPDEELFLDVSRSVVIFTRARRLKDAGTGRFKLMSFITLESDTRDGAQALDQWQMARLAAQPALDRLVLACTHYHTLPGAARGLVTTGFDESNRPRVRFDAVSELQFESLEALHEAASGLDAPPGASFRVISRELPIYGVPDARLSPQ